MRVLLKGLTNEFGHILGIVLFSREENAFPNQNAFGDQKNELNEIFRAL